MISRSLQIPVVITILVFSAFLLAHALTAHDHSHPHDLQHDHNHDHIPDHNHKHAQSELNSHSNPVLDVMLLLSSRLHQLLSPLHDLPTHKAALTASLLSSSVSLISVVFLPFSSLLSFLLLPFAAGALLSDLAYHLLPHTFSTASHTSTPAVLLASVAFFALVDVLIRQLSLHHHNHSHSANDLKPPARNDSDQPELIGVSTAYINLVADAVHNFCDGLTIAAAFTVSSSAGIATTIATILHELPQELADFTLLLRAGFSTWYAILANVVCASTALAGTFIALRISSLLSPAAQQLVMPIASAAMLYLTFASVLPNIVALLARPAPPTRFLLRILGAMVSAIFGVVVVATVEAVHHHSHSP